MCRTGRAFTLIEVLVVVAIIALLVAILIPSLSRARENARSTACMSNEHEIGIALRMYAQQNNGFLPQQIPNLIEWITEPARKAFEREMGANATSSKIASRSGLYHRMLFCPNDDIARDPSLENMQPWPSFDVYGTRVYRIGYYYLGNPTWSGAPSADAMWIDVNKNGKTRDEYISKIDEKLAGQTIVLTCRIIPQGPKENWKFRHPLDSKKGWSNVVMGDGHAEPRPYFKAMVRWYPPNPVGW